MIKDFIAIITKPVATFEKKFDNKLKKILILLGVLVGVFFVADLISMMYSILLSSKGWDGKMHFEVLKEINYLKYILEFIFKQVIFFGSIFIGIFIYTAITKKDFKLIDVVTLILVAYTLNYLVQAATNIIFMFDFTNIKILNTIESVLITTANYYSIAIIVLGLQKLFGFKFNDKDLISLVIMFVVTFSVRYLLYLAI